jgi:hypothetical protein
MSRPSITENPWDSPNDPNKTHILKFLKHVSNEKTKKNKIKQLRWILTYFYDSFDIKFILDYEPEEFRAIWHEIDAMQVSRHEKRSYWKNVKQYVQHCEDPYKAKGKQYNDTVFDYIFSDRFIRQQFREMGRKLKKNHISPGEWNDFLSEVRHHCPRDYIMYRFFQSSCRPGGLVNIKVENIHLEEHYFITKEKMTKANSGFDNRYFFAEEFVPEIRWYISVRHLQPKDRLFPIRVKSVNRRLKQYRPNWQSYDFRRSIKQLWKRAGMDVVDRMVLANQKSPEKKEEIEVKIDAIYSEEDEIQFLANLYEKYFQLIFRTNT